MRNALINWAGVLTLCGSNVLLADTFVCGNVVNQTWSKANSPYHVTCDAVVSGLTIEPGVVVLFDANCVFRVAGRLTAIGTSIDPIVFTSTNALGGWQGIYFNQNPPGSEMAYCVVSKSANSGIRIYRATPSIRDCLITDNSAPEAGGGVIVTNDSLAGVTLKLENCVISNNVCRYTGGGIFAVMGTNELSLLQCDVCNNAVNPQSLAGSASGGGVRVQGNGRFVSCEISANRCNARGNSVAGGNSSGGGLYLEQGSWTMENTTICENVSWGESGGQGVSAYGAGICVNSGTLAATNSVLLGNELRPVSRDARGSGVYLSSSHLWLLNSIVAHNKSSVADVSGSAISLMGSTTSADIINCTVAFNDQCGLYRGAGTAAVRNSIVHFNGVTPEISGAATVTYSCVGGGYDGIGNISLEPFFTSPDDFILLPYSPCIDAGDPAPEWNDTCFPPSQGSAVNDMGAYGGPFACRWAGLPQILSQPADQSLCLGKSAAFCVKAWGKEPLEFQWFYNDVAIAGATNPCLKFAITDTNQAGIYHVVVTNPWGSVPSRQATLAVSPAGLSIAFYAGLTINGEVGKTYRLEWSSGLEGPTDWFPLTNITLTVPETLWFDPASAGVTKRFYRIGL